MNSVSSVSDKISNLIWSQLQLLTNCRGLDLHLVRQEGEVLGRGYISIFIWPLILHPHGHARQFSNNDLT